MPGADSGSTASVQDPTEGAPVRSHLTEVANRDVLPFRHVRNIGRGSSAVIELVAHKSTSKTFALKSFPRYNASQFKNAKQALENEVGIMKRLSPHIHMVQVLEAFQSACELGIIMSPVASHGDLARYISTALESGVTNEQRVVMERAFGCLASGLVHIHKHTIRHKDIKPQNILIHHGRVLYTDFGLSFDAESQETTTIGYPGAYTPRYCAPEVQDWSDRNRKSDIYSLGCVFVEILDVLEPDLGFRSMDMVPYHQKTENIRQRLFSAGVGTSASKNLYLVCHDMLHPDQNERPETKAVLDRIIRLDRCKNDLAVSYFCGDCSNEQNSDTSTSKDSLANDITALSLNPIASFVVVVSRETENEDNVDKELSESNENEKKKKKKRKSALASSFSATSSRKVSRYYCSTCGELGHSSNRCRNECRACGELYHKASDCPNKCWTCEEVGHFARDCPNECDACDQIGHPTEDCPNRCWTCGEVGHFSWKCPDKCFVCGKKGHPTRKCAGKCHRCGKIGHWSPDCDDSCQACGELGHRAAQCTSKRKGARPKDKCPRCGKFGHWASECLSERKGWRPIFEQVPQGPYKVKSRRND